ncbi:MAG: hypothetical protein F4062_02755 [Acidimicrobiia bacterium]|nr:hypothetical protein [Acidimicrobiia bacterium]
MDANARATSPPGVAIALAALALLITAGCGDTTEPEQVRTTAAPAAPTAGAVAPGPDTPAPTSPEPTPTPPPEPTAPPQGDARVHGTVTYRERIALTPEATLVVQLRDTSLMDVASELIAEQVVPNPGQVPINFEVLYESVRIDPRNTYSVSARITEADGRLAFINDTAYDVITRDNPSRVDMVLVMVEPPPEMVDGEWNPEDAGPVEAPVTVTGAELLWEGSDLYVRVTFVVAEQDGCYHRGREEATVDGTTINVTVTAWVPPPTPWAIDCSEETLELDAIAHVDAPFTSGRTYTVAVNGRETLTFTAS